MSKRTIDETGRDEAKQRTSEEHRLNRAEMALRVIRTWAACWSMAFESPEKAMSDIKNKCDEVLK